MPDKIAEAFEIAQSFAVSTEPDCAVVYSISYMPTSKNKTDALNYKSAHPNAKILDDTPCGQALIALGLDGRVDEVGEQITNIWKIASTRFIKEASGNIRAFVTGADSRSTFCTTELPEIMNNPHITHINGQEKQVFFSRFSPEYYK